jgi:hypothetical protein
MSDRACALCSPWRLACCVRVRARDVAARPKSPLQGRSQGVRIP